jgi:hypothetical protein
LNPKGTASRARKRPDAVPLVYLEPVRKSGNSTETRKMMHPTGKFVVRYVGGSPVILE